MTDDATPLQGGMAGDLAAIEVRSGVIRTICEHAEAEAPNECCGLLIGVAGRIDEAVPARNLTPGPFGYRVDPADHFAAIRRARTDGTVLAGAYHSHPATAAVPSPTDLSEALYREFLYLIISLADPSQPPVIRGFRLIDGNFREVRLVTVP